MIPHPPQLPSYGITRDVRMRFAANALSTLTVTFQNLLDLILVANSTTTAFDLFESVRVNSVELWSIAALGTQATAILVYDGTVVGAAGDQKTHTDTSMGVEPAHVKARPAKMTQAALYQMSTSNTAFYLAAPAGAIVDVSLSLRNPLLGNSVAVQNALVGATVGAVYVRGLDGVAVATSKFTPQGVLSTA